MAISTKYFYKCFYERVIKINIMIHVHVTKISVGILRHFLANIQNLIEKEHYTSRGI